ncbi:MAG: hypothetical protein BMS9Abin05_2368 [Rhodothermia bacterium]|nr:MAG: hypothetical protein BMS9Abin05_2368 [Rhodothermia bacterium]
MGVTVAISSGFSVLTFLLFMYLLLDCMRRNEADFPTLVYGGKAISQRVVKKTWKWILILSFIFGLSATQQIWSHSSTKSLPPGTVESNVPVTLYRYFSPFFTYKVEQVGDNETRERAVRIPLFFFLGAYLYYRGVKRFSRLD